MTFHRPFHRSSTASIAYSNAPANGHSIACHHPFHRRCSIPPHPWSDGTRRSAGAALARSQSLDPIWRWAARGTGWPTSAGSDGKIKRTSFARRFVPKYLSARCFSAAPSSSNGAAGSAFLVFLFAFKAPRDGGVGRALMGPPLLRHNKQF